METTQTTPATITGSKLKPGMTITDRGETLTLGKRIHCHRGSGCVGFIVNGARRAFHRDVEFGIVTAVNSAPCTTCGDTLQVPVASLLQPGKVIRLDCQVCLPRTAEVVS